MDEFVNQAKVEAIIALAWADDIPFKAIEEMYELSESEVRKFMRRHQTEKTYIRWRRRVEKLTSRLHKINRQYK